MPAILLKDVPPAVHRRLKQNALAQRRSLQQEALLTLERGMNAPATQPASVLLPPVPVKTKIPLTPAFIRRARMEGRP